jgi:uroporphyrinogen-III synthase
MQSSVCILVTRPDPGGAELCERIQAQGDIALHFPTIVFAPPQDVSAFEQSIKQLGQQDWLLFVSPQAVRASVPAIRRAWPQFPESVRFAAVGAGTAKALEQAGYRVNCLPDSEWSSEGLLDSPEFQAIDDQRVAVVRGEGGREILEKILTDRGAVVISVIAYERTKPVVDTSPYLALLRDGKVDVIVCTSFEGVSNLKQLLGDAGWPALKQVPLIVVSERIKALAQDAGFRTIWVASNASHEAILAVVAQRRNELCQSR